MASTRSEQSRSPFAAFQVKYFTLVWLSGLIWHMCRWGVAFVGTYLINEMTGSPRLVQLAGTMLYAPLLLGGAIGGVISDRFDRLNTVRSQMALLVPLAIVVGLLVRADRIEVWMLYVFMFVVGLGWVSDMTSRRALVFDLVGEDRLDNAMAMEALSLSLGMVFGALVGGYAIDAIGIGAAYFCVAGLAALGFAALLRVSVPPAPPRDMGATSARADLIEGLKLLRRSPGVVSILGVTVIANFFLFSYFPIIPVVAEALDASAVLVGLLAGGTGIGMMTGSLIVARTTPHHRGRVYLVGVFAALVLLVPFALANVYWLALVCIIASGVGSGFFGATQSTLAMVAVPEEVRGRTLGLLSMAIGALPIGMYALGETAERIGATAALITSAVAGIVVLAVWIRARPEVAHMVAEA